jgi:hypothetical protein
MVNYQRDDCQNGGYYYQIHSFGIFPQLDFTVDSQWNGLGSAWDVTCHYYCRSKFSNGSNKSKEYTRHQPVVAQRQSY